MIGRDIASIVRQRSPVSIIMRDLFERPIDLSGMQILVRTNGSVVDAPTCSQWEGANDGIIDLSLVDAFDHVQSMHYAIVIVDGLVSKTIVTGQWEILGEGADLSTFARPKRNHGGATIFEFAFC